MKLKKYTNMIIKFQIVKALVFEAVKNATLIKGRFDEATGQTSKAAMGEAAGDDTAHERLLDADFTTSLELLKTTLVDYIVPTPSTIGNNVIYYEDKTNDIVEFTLNVSRRYNGTLTDTLARLSAKFAEDYMTYQWWTRLGNTAMAQPSLAAFSSDEQAIRRCFILCAPRVPVIPYPTSISVSSTGNSDGVGGFTVEKGEHNTITYSINGGAIDDIEARSDNPSVLAVCRSEQKAQFCLVALNTGIALVTLFSRHRDNVKKEFFVTVTEEEGYDE